jgi:hypothetical protein
VSLPAGSERPARVSAYAGGRGAEEPRRLLLEDGEVDVEVIDRWREPQGRFFRVRDAEGRVHVLVVDADGRWWIRV